MKNISFKDFIVWQKAMTLTKEVYLYTHKLPKEELYGLTSQIRRCAISVPSNIAEGKHRSTQKDFKYFLHIAFGSLAELETQLLLASDLYLKPPDSIFDLILEIRKILATLIHRMQA